MDSPFVFPSSMVDHDSGDLVDFERGLELRDYFAAAALPTLLQLTWEREDLGFSDVAEMAYFQADALVKEREARR